MSAQRSTFPLSLTIRIYQERPYETYNLSIFSYACNSTGRRNEASRRCLQRWIQEELWKPSVLPLAVVICRIWFRLNNVWTRDCLRDNGIWVLFSWIDLSYQPSGKKAYESDRPVDKFRLYHASFVCELSGTDFILFKLDSFISSHPCIKLSKNTPWLV